jgi:hypothetical protein
VADPLVRVQGPNRRRPGSSVVAKPAFLLLELGIATKQILMGAPIGCPNVAGTADLTFIEIYNLSWGTHKNRTRGSIWKICKIVID